MNAQPHTHKPKIERRYGYGIAEHSFENPWLVKYGDTEVRICNGRRVPDERMVRKATLKAIRKHDEGSVHAGRSTAALADLQRVAESVQSEWAER